MNTDQNAVKIDNGKILMNSNVDKKKTSFPQFEQCKKTSYINLCVSSREVIFTQQM